jgi:signal transduction histidine kinase
MRVEMTDTNVRFIVQDVGPGLPEDSKKLIEQPFVKLHETSEGLGLGLPLSKRHAVNLGGELIHDTTYRKGCRIIMVLPR